MQKHHKSKLIENTLLLVLLGILAGVAGGFAIGVVSQHSASSSAGH